MIEVKMNATTTIDRAASLAKTLHSTQKYDHMPYFEGHVVPVVEEVKNHTTDIDIIAAAFLHDVVEDTDVGLEAIHKMFGATVGSVVYLVTDPDGDNRKQRKEKLYRQFDEVRGEPIAAGASLVKCADRYVNHRMCINTLNISKMRMYVSEFPDFIGVFGPALRETYGVDLYLKLFSQYAYMITVLFESAASKASRQHEQAVAQ